LGTKYYSLHGCHVKTLVKILIKRPSSSTNRMALSLFFSADYIYSRLPISMRMYWNRAMKEM
jgi:hypothetical protein